MSAVGTDGASTFQQTDNDIQSDIQPSAPIAVEAPPNYIPYTGLTPSPSYSFDFNTAAQSLPPHSSSLHYPQASAPTNPYQSHHSHNQSTHLWQSSLPSRNYGTIYNNPHERLPSYKVFSNSSVQINEQGQVIGVGPSGGRIPRISRVPIARYQTTSGGNGSNAPSAVVYVPQTGIPSLPPGIVLPICPGSLDNYHEFVDRFTLLGILCAIFCFPLGLLCCFLGRERKCERCGYVLDLNR